MMFFLPLSLSRVVDAARVNAPREPEQRPHGLGSNGPRPAQADRAAQAPVHGEATPEAGGGGGAGVLSLCMHDRNRMTIEISHPYYTGTEHVGFSSTRQTLLAPCANRH